MMPGAEPRAVSALFDAPEYRVEGPLKVTGRARYTVDVQLPGMLWARFLLSPFAHARIVSIDTSAARAVSGVHAVLTGADIGPIRFGRVLYDCPVLAYDRALFVGDRVAAVAADTREAAEEAVRLIEVEYEELPAAFDAEDALREDAPVLHPDWESYYHHGGPRLPITHPNLQGYRLNQKGDPDIEAQFAGADLVIEDVFTVARQHQGYIEPHACVVWIEPSGTVRVYSTNKAPFTLRQQLAKVTGLPIEQIVVDSMFIGGDFGGKGHSIEEFPCYYLARATGRPVKAVMTYAEELGAANPRNSSKLYFRTGVSRDGRILAHQSRVYYDDGAYAAGRPLAGPMLDGSSAMSPYRIPHARLETFLVYTNLVPGGQMRAPGSAHTGFAGESHIDHIARELGIDTLEFRLLNVLRDGDAGLSGRPVTHSHAADLLETVRRETSWGKPLPPNRGRGLSLRTRGVGEGKTAVALRLLAGGRVEVLSGAADQGGGSATVAQRVAAAVLSLDPERVAVRYGTTEEAPFNPGAGASRTTHIVGQATIAGATSLKEKLEELAAEVMGWPAGAVRLEGGHFVVASEGQSAPFEEVSERILRGGHVEAFGEYDSEAHAQEDADHENYCVCLTEVEVDPATGQVKPIDAVLVADVGTIINPLAHAGQLEGGFVFGLGNALSEEILIEDGKVTTLSLGDYKLPTSMDVPPLRIILVPGAVGPGPFGAKSVGETVNNAVAPSIANAISDAVGVRVTAMPMTAERVLDALTQRKK